MINYEEFFNFFFGRLRLNSLWREHLIDLTEKDFIAEKRAATKDLEEKIVDLKENLIQDMEDKRKVIEAERVNMELSGISKNILIPLTIFC